MQYVFFNEKLRIMNLVQAALGMVRFLPARYQDEVYELVCRFRTEDGYDYHGEFTVNGDGITASVHLERIDDGIRISGEDETVRLENLIKKEIRKLHA